MIVMRTFVWLLALFFIAPLPTSAATPSDTITLVFDNKLIASVNITVNGDVVGSVPAEEVRQIEIDPVESVTVEWSLIRPMTTDGKALGDKMSGNFNPISNPAETQRFTIDNITGEEHFFAPVITNTTDVGLLMGVNMGLQAENRCECTVPAQTSEVLIGYYRFFSNSTVRAYRAESNYTGRFIFWDDIQVEPSSGKARLRASTPPLLPSPDLTGTITKLKVKQRKAGDHKVIVKLQVRNDGTEIARGPFSISLFLSDNAVLDANDELLDTRIVTEDLLPGETSDVIKLKQKGLPPVTGFVIVVIDDDNQVTESDEPNNILVQQIKGAAAAARTNETGQVTLTVAGQDVSFTFVDETTGSPIPGLTMGFALDPETEGQAVLLIIDPFEQYPPQIVILQGETPTASELQDTLQKSSALKANASSETIRVLVSTAKDRIVKIIPTTQLPRATTTIIRATGIFKAIEVILKSIDAAGLPVIKRLEGIPLLCTSPRDPISVEDALVEFTADQILGIATSAFLAALAPPTAGASLPLAAGILAVNTASSSFDFTTISMCLGKNSLVRVTSCAGGFLKFYRCEDEASSSGDLHRVTVFATRPEPGEVPCTAGSLELLSRANLNTGFVTVLDTEGKATIPVPVGNYVMRVTPSPPGLIPTSAPGCEGFAPDTRNIQVPAGGIMVNVSLQPQPIAKVTLFSDPDLTGFLGPGTQVQFTAVATDVDGNVVPCDAIFVASNPVGSKVATIDAASGLLTVGPDDGAVKVTARCGGLTSNPILVSGTGEGEAPPPPPPPEGECPSDSLAGTFLVSSTFLSNPRREVNWVNSCAKDVIALGCFTGATFGNFQCAAGGIEATPGTDVFTSQVVPANSTRREPLKFATDATGIDIVLCTSPQTPAPNPPRMCQ